MSNFASRIGHLLRSHVNGRAAIRAVKTKRSNVSLTIQHEFSRDFAAAGKTSVHNLAGKGEKFFHPGGFAGMAFLKVVRETVTENGKRMCSISSAGASNLEFAGLLMKPNTAVAAWAKKVGYQVRRIASSSTAAARGTVPLAASAAASSSGATVAVQAMHLPLVTGSAPARRAVAWWLFGASGWVFTMVILGGVTRLTRSGLSMTDWKLTGSLPPLNDQEWALEFHKYQASPEYKRVNKGMGVEEFKFIYWMEYAHRMWGRFLGLYFAAPFLYFAARGYITRPLGGRLLFLFGLGGCQGLIGWWMVKSGLEEPATEFQTPRVSPYRLAAHLTSAFVIYSGLLWTALNVALPVPPAESAAQVAAALRARPSIHAVAMLVGLTAVSGAFVAGNDAGHAFNTFPKMGDTWLPPGMLEMQPIVRNFFENTATVQFDHRILATSTLAAVAALWVATSRLPLHPASQMLLNATLGMTALQVTLGITTLLNFVPVSLGTAHQAGALTLFSILLTLLHTVRSRQMLPLKKLHAHSPKSLSPKLNFPGLN